MAAAAAAAALTAMAEQGGAATLISLRSSRAVAQKIRDPLNIFYALRSATGRGQHSQAAKCRSRGSAKVGGREKEVQIMIDVFGKKSLYIHNL